MKAKEFHYFDERGTEIHLNHELAMKQGCDDREMWLITDAHTRRIAIFKQMSNTPREDIRQLRSLAYSVECIEYELQGYWHFKQDRDFHTFWFKMPHCSCPKMDNADSMYFGRRITVQGCPFHWTEDD